MTFCYDYNADRYCEKCGLEIIKQLDELDQIELENSLDLVHRAKLMDYNDSNNYPQKTNISDIDPGAPDHCGNCNVFLEHTLNEECKNYVLETVYCDLSMYGEIGPIVQQWIDFWEIDINQDSDIKKLLVKE
jgi:hypothetical protein